MSIRLIFNNKTSRQKYLDMKRIIVASIAVLMILISCENEEGDIKPNKLSASDGFTVGCIHIEFEREENITVMIERREKGTENWIILSGGVGSTSFDDNEKYTEGGMPPGKVFEYRVRNDMGDNTEYSEIEEGFAFNYVPVNELEINSTVDYKDDLSNSLKWNAGNHNSFINESEIYFNVCRSSDSLGNYEVVATVGEDRSYIDIIPANERGGNIYYRIDIFYKYKVLNFRGATIWYETSPLSGTIHNASYDQGGNPIASYTSVNLGQITASTQGGITQLLEKKVNGILYLGIMDNAGAAGYGIPKLYSFNGSSWQNEWSTNPPNEFNKINYAIGTSSHYLAGIHGSLYVYEWNGSSWSTNLTPDNLGQADAPAQVSIEVDNDNIYMAISQYPDYNLQVLKYAGGEWDTIGGDQSGIIASGNIYNVSLEKSGGELYLYYLIDNTLNIKHLIGTTWETDLTWTKDNIASIDIARSSSDLYFIIGTVDAVYRGGVYKVTSSTNAEEIVSYATDDWFQFPLSIAIDSEDNLIVSSMKFVSAEIFYPYLNLYNGTDWQTISGDFSDGMDPVSVGTMGTDIIYVYGDASSENASGDPTAIKSKKLTK